MDDLERELLEEKRLTIARLERELNEEVQTGLKYLGERNEKIKELAAVTTERDGFRGIFGEYDVTATLEQARVIWNTLKQQLASITTERDEAIERELRAKRQLALSETRHDEIRQLCDREGVHHPEAAITKAKQQLTTAQVKLDKYAHWTPEHTIEEWLADRQRIVDAKQVEADAQLQATLAAQEARIRELEGDA